MNKTASVFTSALLCAVIYACAAPYPALVFERKDDAFHLNGVIDERALTAFDEAVAAEPGIKTLIFEYVPGSLNDDANLELARKVHNAGFTTRILKNGLIASGGTDLFLAGVKRHVETGACIGVHTWGDADYIGSEVPENHPDHQPYLAYYKEIGIDESFYWYTLKAAGPDDAHWMTQAEQVQYAIALPKTETPNEADSPTLREECEIRLSSGF